MAEQPEQIDGTHYQTKVQHWDWAQYLPYLEGNCTKYIGRHFEKNGLVDIQKALSFIDKIVRKWYGKRLVWKLIDLDE